jgi:hypothetical protein
VKSCGETALAGDEVRTAFEDLRGHTGGDTSRLAGERTSHIKSAGRIATGDDLNSANCLRPRCLCGVQCVLGGGGARCNLRHVEVTGKTLLFALVGEFRILMVDIERFLCVRFLLRGFDRSEIRARHGSGQRLPGKFVVGFQRVAFSPCGSFFRANAPPHIGLPCGTGCKPIHPTL